MFTYLLIKLCIRIKYDSRAERYNTHLSQQIVEYITLDDKWNVFEDGIIESPDPPMCVLKTWENLKCLRFQNLSLSGARYRSTSSFIDFVTEEAKL